MESTARFGRLAAFCAPLLAGLVMTLSAPGAGHAASFTADSVEDRDVPNYQCTNPVWANQGACTLRTAMRLAVAAGGSSTIRLVGAKNGTKDYKLTKPLPTVTSTLVISGDGDVTKIWGPCTSTFRDTTGGHCGQEFSSAIFFVTDSGNLTLSNLAIHNGWSTNPGAGGVVSNGTLELDRVTMVGNGTHQGAGAIFVGGGSASIDNSTIRENTTHHGPAGGIFVASGATLTITGSTISGNRSIASDFNFPTQAGGIANEGLVAIQSCTLTGNLITKDNAAIPFAKEAGGIANRGEAWLNNVTIAGNNVLGIKNHPEGRFFFANSLIAANGDRFLSKEDNPDCIGNLITLRGNVVGDPGRKDGTKFLCNLEDWSGLPSHKASDLVGRVNFSGPLPLADIFKGEMVGGFFRPALENDGGYTCTVPLCTGRAGAIACATRNTGFATNAAWPSWGPPNLACWAQDQKGAWRTNTCDAGAYEIGALPEIYLDTLKCSGLETPP